MIGQQRSQKQKQIITAMKLLGLVLQNKKGQNIVMVSAPSLPTRFCAMYSHMIYQHILETYRNRLKIERTIALQENLLCVCNITKDYILYIFTMKYDLSLAIDGIRKVNEYFNKPGTTLPAKMELILKKPVEFMSIFQEFLYTRELSLRDFIPMKHPHNSKKKSVDDEIFNKFAHIGNENDKNTIFTSQVKSSQIEGLEAKRKVRVTENAEKFVVRSQDDTYLLDIDPEKENYMNKYKKSIFKLAMGKKTNLKKYSNPNINVSSVSSYAESYEPSSFMVNTTVEEIKANEEKVNYFQEKAKAVQKLKLRIKEKLSLQLHNDKVKEVQQHGQIFVEGSQAQQASIVLVNEAMWGNPKIVSKRITPNSIPCKMTSDFQYLINTPEGFKSKPIIDYVLRTETFSPDKIPLLFIYTMQVNSSNIEFTFKYKLNEKWKSKIFDLEITVYLNKQFVVLDCKSIPVAHSLKNNKVVWKTKEISPGSSNSKGKILLAFGQAKFPSKQILSEVRLSMKSTSGLIQSMGVLCKQKQLSLQSTAQRILLIDYKIHP